MKQAIALLALANFGCASIVTGTNQTLSVETKAAGARVIGASCKLFNDKGVWFVTTPGSVTVHRSYDALHVSCEKEGYAAADYAANSSTKAMLAGNIIFGGLIGAGVDIASGAAYDYPDLISFEMVRTMPLASPQAPAAPTARVARKVPGHCDTYSLSTGRFTCN